MITPDRITHFFANMTEASSSVGTQTVSKKNVPEMLSELLDLAIFSFSCQSGLRASHKIRGDPVLEGVAAFFGRLISCSNPETQAQFKDFSYSRLGNWQPQHIPSKEILTLISSRMKTSKTNGVIGEDRARVPSILFEEKEKMSEEEERVKTILYPRCWRCSQRCEFCLKRRKRFPKIWNFNTDLASPFLDVLEGLLDDDDDDTDNEGQEDLEQPAKDDDDDGDEGDDDDDSDELLLQCTSDIDFPESEGDEEKEDEGSVGGEMEEDSDLSAVESS